MTFKNYKLLFLLIVHPLYSFSQNDSLITHDGHSDVDSFYFVTENEVTKNRFLGNSWYFAAGYNLNKYHETDLSIGRTLGESFCSGAGCIYGTQSWGLGYGYQFHKNDFNHIGKAFWEATIFYFFPVSAGARMEYQYNFSKNEHYLRPHVGFSFVYFDILYNYTIPIQKGKNPYKHGINLRIKLFHKKKNWEKRYPNHC